MTMTMSMSMVI